MNRCGRFLAARRRATSRSHRCTSARCNKALSRPSPEQLARPQRRAAARGDSAVRPGQSMMDYYLQRSLGAAQIKITRPGD